MLLPDVSTLTIPAVASSSQTRNEVWCRTPPYRSIGKLAALQVGGGAVAAALATALTALAVASSVITRSIFKEVGNRAGEYSTSVQCTDYFYD